MTDKILSIQADFTEVLAKVDTLKTDAEKRAALSAVQLYLNEFNAATNLIQLSEEKPDLSHIPLWDRKIKDRSAIEWLDKYYGQWLKRCGADQNYIYRQDILAHDKRLVKSVSDEARKVGKKPREYIPTKSDKIDEKGEKIGFTPETQRTVSTLQRRKYGTPRWTYQQPSKIIT